MIRVNLEVNLLFRANKYIPKYSQEMTKHIQVGNLYQLPRSVFRTATVSFSHTDILRTLLHKADEICSQEKQKP